MTYLIDFDSVTKDGVLFFFVAPRLVSVSVLVLVVSRWFVVKKQQQQCFFFFLRAIKHWPVQFGYEIDPKTTELYECMRRDM